MAFKKPIKIGKYEVAEVLGKGGMGVVYKGTDPLLGRPVAIKMMTTFDYVDNPELLQRFYREAQSTGSLHHRNIVTVYELGDQDGSPYLVMEYIEGETLDAILRSNRPPSLLECINYVIEVCEGMAYAHQRSVVHRDIKPGNIMVQKDGGVKIVDFGIAHIGNRTVTRTGQLLGSLSYMSPEQISGKLQVDARTDIFSLGVVLYQLLTLHLPFEGETPAATLLKIVNERPRPLREYKASLPQELESVVLRALAKDREERYPTAQDFAFDLVQIRGRIQQEIIDESLSEAESLLAHEDFLKAKEKLSEVLKIDRHNTRAVELSRALRQRIQQQELGAQARQLRGRAEEAFQRDEFVVALDLIQRAISLHSTDPDLQRFRSTVQEAKSRAERLQHSIQRAESAYEQGELDSAKQAIEEALGIAPDDVQAKALHRTIQRDWTRRAQRIQVQNLIEEAREEIASRNFTLALEVLRKAEAIDPADPQLQALIEAAKAAREQEQRRKELDDAKREIEGDLDRDDFQLACNKAEAALQKFPDDRGLQKLRDLAVKQRAIAERNYFIEEQGARARKLLEAGRTEEALDLLQAAQQKVGEGSHLDSLLVVVRETLERQRIEARKVEYTRRAKDQLRLKEFDEAIRTLEAAQAELGKSPEIDDLLQFSIEQAAAETRRRIADAAAQEAQALIKAQDYDKAVEVLEKALHEAPDEELRIILVQTRHAGADYKKRLCDALVNAESMIQGQRPHEALAFLNCQPGSYSRDPRFVELLEEAGRQAERLQRIQQAVEKARVLLEHQEFDTARSVLEECAQSHGRTSELDRLQSEIEDRQAQAVADMLERAMADGRALMGAGRPGDALERLALAQTIVGKVSPTLTRAYSALQEEAAVAKARKHRADVEEMLAKGDHAAASDILQKAQAEFPDSRELQRARKALDQAVRRRSEARELLEGAQDLFRQKSWRDGADTCLRAGPLSRRDPIVHKEILLALEEAAEASLATDWRHAEYLLLCMTQFQPDAVLPTKLQEDIAHGKREEAILQTLREAENLLARGDLDKTLERVEAALAAYPGEARLSAMQQKLVELWAAREEERRLERERKAKEEFLSQLRNRLEHERSPEVQAHVLAEALQRYPEDATLEKELAKAQSLWQKVTSLAQQAHFQEGSRNYERAVQNWLAIRELGVPHSDLDSSLDRLRCQMDEARAAVKAAWIRAIQDALAAYHIEEATGFLDDAEIEMPGDVKFKELRHLRDKAVHLRQDGLKSVAEAQKSFAARQWEEGAGALRRCLQNSGPDPVVSGQVFACLVASSRAALSRDLRVAEDLLGQAVNLQPASPEVAELRVLVEKETREEIVRRHLASAQAIVDAGDAEAGLGEINSALSSYPDDPRLLDRKQELEKDIQFEKEVRERNNRLAEILEQAQSLRSQGDLAGALAKVNDGLVAFPGHAQFLEMKHAVEDAIRDQKERALQEEKERRAQKEKKEKEERERQQRLEEEKREEAAGKASAEQARQAEKREEAKDRQPDTRKKEKVTEIRKPPEQPRVRKGSDTEISGGTALRSEQAPPVPALGPTPIQASPGLADRAGIEASSQLPLGSRSLKLYAGSALALAIVTVLGAALWRSEHKPSASGPIPGTIALRITVSPADAKVRVKDSDQACSTPECSLNVPPGTYTLEVEHPGYQPLTQTITVGQDSSNQISLALSPIPSSPPAEPSAKAEAPSHLELRGARPGTEVLVDQQRAGTVGKRGTFSTRVPAGNHAIELIAKDQPNRTTERVFASGERVRLDAGDFAPAKVAPSNAVSTPNAAPSAEETEWRKVENSTNVADLDAFLKRYPAGPFSAQAQAKADRMYWDRATSANTIAAFNQYMERFPQGQYSPQAQTEIATLEWHSVENSTDKTALRNFLTRHSSGPYHDKALARLDDVTWQETKQDDPSSLSAYVQNYPNGRHAAEARRKLEDLTRAAKVVRTTPPPRVPGTSPVDEKKMVLDVLNQYKKAYESRDIRKLHEIWPAMPAQSMKGLSDFFQHASDLTLEYRLNGEPDIKGEQATVNFSQSLKWSMNGRSQKDSAQVVMQLSKTPGQSLPGSTPDAWRIDSIR